MAFSKHELKSWTDLQNYLRPRWIFRGQRAESWRLETTFERCCNRERIDFKDRREFEWKLCREFRRAYHHYAPHVPAAHDTLEWLSIMQHHGAPTRFLDFTYSIYVALYFAIENAEAENCAIWAINGPWALDESVALMKGTSGKDDAELLKDLYVESHMKKVPKFFFKAPPVPCACPQNAFRLNQRLQIQKGVFLIPGSVEMTFEDNLMRMRGHDDVGNVVKLTLPASQRKETLQALFDMSISRTSLFPGLDGYAQSLGVYHSCYRPGTSKP